MNKTNHFVISYAGNKRKEVEKIYESIKDKLNNIEYIIEPYCGTSALSCYISQQHPKKFKYILNDNNEKLVELYNVCKSKTKTSEIYKSLAELSKTIKNKEDYDKLKSNDSFLNWLYLHTVYSMRAGLYPVGKRKIEIDETKISKILDRDIFHFLQNENVTILNEDGLTLYKKHCDDSKTFIFLDPPYLLSCNQFYKSPVTAIYEFLSNNDIRKEKAFIILCLENNWIIKIMFRDFNIITYEKKYEISKSKTAHVIVSNV